MQTILGSGGAIANYLAKELVTYTDEIRLVSRHPKKINNTDELFSADLLKSQQVNDAVKGSHIVYLTVGLPYNTKLWKQQWKLIMSNVIAACKLHKAKLVFFDNVYMYGLVDGYMTEETPFQPISKKGNVRAEIAIMLLKAMASKEIEAVIVRSADFFGDNTQNSMLNTTVIDKLKVGKKAQLMVSDKTVHSYTYTLDAAKATALIGNTDWAFNQTWHLPSHEIISGQVLVEKIALALNMKPNYTVTPKWLLTFLSLFIPIVKESMEMLYQYEYDYMFSDDKFLKTFPDFKKTEFETIIKEMNS